jgi:ribosomal protein S21
MSKRPVNLVEKPRGKNDTPERMIRRFMKKIKKYRILDEYRESLVFTKDSEIKRKEKKKRKKILDKLREEEKRIMDPKDDPYRIKKKRKTRN